MDTVGLFKNIPWLNLQHSTNNERPPTQAYVRDLLWALSSVPFPMFFEQETRYKALKTSLWEAFQMFS